MLLMLSAQGRVAGQAEAVSAAARALRRAGAGLRDRRRPVAALLFCGPTGVGKTHLAKVSPKLPSRLLACPMASERLL